MMLDRSRWIAPDRPSASPVFERRFCWHGGEALLEVTGLGFYEARVNGKKLGDCYFIPTVTDYMKRDYSGFTYLCRDSFTYRIFYNTYDLRELLHEGENLLEIQLGGGYFVQTERVAEGRVSFSDRGQCLFALKLEGEILRSDGSERWHDSAITQDNLFLGETVDLTADTSGRRPVLLLPTPESALCPQEGTPDRLIRTLAPTKVGEVNGRQIYDVGENIAGFVRVTTHAPAGSRITLRFAERLMPDGSPDFRSAGSGYTCTSGVLQIMTDVFITDGGERSFEPKFVWHAFRYIEADGPFDSLTVCEIHADTPVTSSFDSDSEGMNFLYDAYLRTQLSNMHGSFPSDCPHRERLGYTGDGQITAPAAMLMLDSREFYRKWIHDILDCQDPATGHIQHTAPFQGGGGGPGGWGSAVITVPYRYWKQYGDDGLIGSCYPAMKRWIAYLTGRLEDGLIVREAEGGWCLGDWCMLESGKLPEPFVNTCWFVKTLGMLCEIAAYLGHEADIPAFRALEDASRGAAEKVYRESLNSVGAAMTYAAWVGIADAADCAAYYDALGHYDTGFLATDILTGLLFDGGYGDVACKLLSSEEKGSFLYMKRNGATTIWENWPGYGSQSHPMFGASARHLFSGILGIRQAEGSYGWEKITFRPYLPEGMERALGSILTPRGRISVRLSREDGKFVSRLQMPDGMICE